LRLSLKWNQSYVAQQETRFDRWWHIAETTLLRMRRAGAEYVHRIGASCSMMLQTLVSKPNAYLLASYRIATAPEPYSSRLMNLKSTGFDSPANNVGPWPASLG
jgi:hypothetical protein